MSKAAMGLAAMAGEAEAAAFAECKSAYTPCVVTLPNKTHVPASCCIADALTGWQSPGPAEAVEAMLAAANSTHNDGLMWWVNINQTLSGRAAPGLVRNVINHQYPNWYPSSCDNATAIAEQQQMFCHNGHIIECYATVENKSHTNVLVLSGSKEETPRLQ